MAWTLKVDLNGDVRRAPGLEWQEAPTFEAVLQIVAHLFGLSEAEAMTLTLQYRDDESDLCTLTRHTMQDALSLAAPSRILRLIASRARPAETQAASKTSVTAPSCGTAMSEKDAVEGSVQRMDIEGNSSASASATASATPAKLGLPPFFEAMAKDFLRGAPLGNANQPNPFGMLQALAGGHRGGCCTPEAAARMIVAHLPMALQTFPLWSVALEQHAAGNPASVASMVQTLRDSLEPFPQMAVAQAALDSALQSPTQLEGVSAAVFTCLETLRVLPTDEQTDILAIVLASVMPAAMASAGSCAAASEAGESSAACSQQRSEQGQQQQQQQHHRHHRHHRRHRPVYTCDGCEARPITGPRYHCKSCPDYDLCSSCYEHKDWLHPGCEFECHQPSADEDDNMMGTDWGFSPWGAGCKGFGKAKAKGFFAGLLAGAGHDPWAPWWHKFAMAGKCKGKFKGKGKGGKCKGKHHWAAPEESTSKAGQASSSSGSCPAGMGMEEGEHFAHPWAWWGPPCPPPEHTWWWGSEAAPWSQHDGHHCCKRRSEEKRSRDAVDKTEKEARREEKRQHRQRWKEAKRELKEQWKREEKERKAQIKAMKQAAKNEANEAAPARHSGNDDESTADSSDGTSSSDSWEDCKEVCREDKKQHQKRWKQAKRELKEQLKLEKKELRQQMKVMKMAAKNGAGPDAGEDRVCEQFKQLAMEEVQQHDDEDADEVQVLEDAANEHNS